MTDRLAVDLAHVRERPDGDRWVAAWRTKERWYARWEDEFYDHLSALDALAGENLDGAIVEALRAQKGLDRDLLRRIVARLMRGRFRQGQAAGRRGANAAYVRLASQTMEDSGHSTLHSLGLNRTFAWAGQRDFVRDQLAVRGSKIIQLAYGSHLERLATVIIRATAPAEPRTIDQVRREVLDNWSRISRSDAQRIARTETGIVWERTNWYAMRANGVERVRWLVAHGPAIGVSVSAPCARCLAMAAGSPYRMDDLVEIPPEHPNCRCTLVPVLDARWLPPAQPWTGSETPIPTDGLHTEAGRLVPKEVKVFKARRIWGNPDTGWVTVGWGRRRGVN